MYDEIQVYSGTTKREGGGGILKIQASPVGEVDFAGDLQVHQDIWLGNVRYIKGVR